MSVKKFIIATFFGMLPLTFVYNYSGSVMVMGKWVTVVFGIVMVVLFFLVPRMIEKGAGSIINIASVQGTACTAGVCAYATTKGGIISFTRTLAVDLAPKGIRANTLSPGSIITPMQEYFADMNAKEGQALENLIINK